MTEIKPQLLRLRVSTSDALRQELKFSAHRSLSSLADELLQRGLESNARQRMMQAEMDRQAGRNG